jgi:hypothetical protein
MDKFEFTARDESPEAQAYLKKNEQKIGEAYYCVIEAKATHEKLMAPILNSGLTDDMVNDTTEVLSATRLRNAMKKAGGLKKNSVKGVPRRGMSIRSTTAKLFQAVNPKTKNRVDIMNFHRNFLHYESKGAGGNTDDVEDDLFPPEEIDNLKFLKKFVTAVIDIDDDLEIYEDKLIKNGVGQPILDSNGKRKYMPMSTGVKLYDNITYVETRQTIEKIGEELIGVKGYEAIKNAVNELIDKIIANIEEAVPCMISLYRHFEKLNSFVKEAVVDAATDHRNAIAAGVDPATAQAQLDRDLARARTPKRSGFAATISRIPENFREQCLFLAQIFQFAEYHRDIQMGSESKTTDTRDKADRMKKSMAQGVASGQISVDKSLPYSGANKGANSSLVVEGEAFGFINKLTQYGSMKNYFEATNAELAHLQPMIRLFKVTPSSGNKEEQLEFPFDTFASKEDVRDIFQKKEKRGFGAGIQKFNFTFHGSNPFAIKKSIKASLQIRANNFSELLKLRKNGLRYIDLALKTGSAIKERYDKSELNFRIKAVVGLSVPNGLTIAKYNIKEGVENNFTTLNLTPITHTFDFDDTGAVTFSIEYLAYIEEYFDKARMNIFADPQISKRIIQRKLAILTQKKGCKEKAEIDKLNKFIKKDAVKVKEDKIKSLQFLTNELLKNDLLYYLNLTTDQFQLLVDNGPFYNLGDIRNSISLSQGSAATKSMAKELSDKFNKRYDAGADSKSLKNSFSISGLENKNFAFFYLGDLIDLILKKIPENLRSLQSIEAEYSGLSIDKTLLEKEKKIITNSIQQFKKFRFILGPLEIIDHREQSQVRQISFADLPISLSYFNEWLTSKLLSNDEVSYSLTTFLNDIMNHFITNFLNDDSCFSFNIKQKVRVFQNVLTAYSDDSNNDSITTYLEDNKFSRLKLSDENLTKPIIKTAGYRDFPIATKLPDKEFHYFVFYAGRVQPKDLMKGNRQQDQGRGIFHYILGREKGIVKTIKLDKTDSPASLKMVRFEQEGYDGLKQLREIYDVNVSTFANVQTYPGTYIYVEPRGFSPILEKEYGLDKFDLTDLGIGGYYMIIESTHEFAPGIMNTNFRAKWVQSIDNDAELQKVTESSIGNGSPTYKKCDVRS